MKINNSSFKFEFFVLVGSLVLVLLFFFKNFNFEVLEQDLKEEILSSQPGFSSWSKIHSGSLTDINSFGKLIKSSSEAFYNKFFSNKHPDYFETLYVDMPFEDYQIILNDRKNAIKAGILTNAKKVKAKITYKNKKIKADVRLKGDLRDHWLAKKRMSLRFNLKEKETILGLSKFSIHKTSARDFPHDAVFQEFVKKNSILSSENHYVKVVVNGEDWGVMHLESHISPEYLERNKRKDSIVVRFSNEDGWSYRNKPRGLNSRYYLLSDPRLYLKGYFSKKKFDIHKREAYSYIVDKRIKNDPMLFDVDSYTRVLILSEIWGSKHALYENNIKHYFSPYTLKLEPITADQYGPTSITSSPDNSQNIFFSGCSDNFSFLSKDTFKSVIENKEFSNNFQNNFDTVKDNFIGLEKTYANFHKIFPEDQKYNYEPISNNLKKLEYSENISDYIFDDCTDISNKHYDLNKKSGFPLHVKAFHYSDGRIKIFNLLPEKVNILGLRINQKEIIDLNSNIKGHRRDYQPLEIKTEITGFHDNKVDVITEFNDEIRFNNTGITLVPDVENPLGFEETNNYKFLLKAGDKWTIKKGNWLIDKPIILKSSLIIEPGANLHFSKNSYLAVNGSIRAIGTPTEKISFGPVKESWKGIYVFNSKERSYLDNVEIRNTTAVADGLIQLTGGINFYKSDIKITNSLFTNSLGEDMLNIVSSNFLIKNVTFDKSFSDAFDSDFSNGEILNVKMNNIGGDGIDTSGSMVLIENLNVSNVFDKAISAGEASDLNIKSCIVSFAGVGVASKDGSNVKIEKCMISNSKLRDVMTYTKKNFYDPPTLIAFDSDINSALRQNGSYVEINNSVIEPEDIDIKKLYKNSFMKKLK